MISADDSAPAPPSPSWWRRLYAALVAVFVAWHLFVLFIANARIESAWVEASVRRYERFVYVDQSWQMFTSPLWTRVPFLAGRVNLSDGTTADVLSENEPADLTRFSRWRGFRHRKLEHLVRGDTRGRYTDAISRRYAEYFARRWRAVHPADPRRVESVTLIERSFAIPPRGGRWDDKPEAEITTLGTYEISP